MYTYIIRNVVMETTSVRQYFYVGEVQICRFLIFKSTVALLFRKFRFLIYLKYYFHWFKT